MSRDVGKGLDPKRDERKTSCTAGDEVCRRRQVMPRETRCSAGDETYRGRRVGSGRHGKTEWGKGVSLTASGHGEKKKKKEKRWELVPAMLCNGPHLHVDVNRR